MLTRFKPTAAPTAAAAFTLAEVVVCIGILALSTAGLIYGYVQTNYRAEWSSMSLAVQALTVQSVEQARAARWDVYSAPTAGSSPDELPAPAGTNTSWSTNIVFTNSVLVPSSGQAMSVTSVLQIINITVKPQPSVRQLRADCVWYFPRTGLFFTNTVITYRAGS